MAPNFFFPGDFHTPNIRTEVKKLNKNTYLVISFNMFSVKSASLYNTLWPRVFQNTSYMNT